MEKRVFIVVDLGFGDSGKGTIVDYLARKTASTTVVRYNGGAQAGHRVVLGDGRSHIFSQFGSGTLIRGVKTLLSRFMLVEPYSLVNEENHLEQLGIDDAFFRLFIARGAPVITPFQIAANRLKELARGASRHGSCGIGVGETMSDLINFSQHALLAGDLLSPEIVKEKLAFLSHLNFEKIKLFQDQLFSNVAAQREYFLFNQRSTTKFIQGFTDFYQQLASKITLVDDDYLKQLLAEGPVIFEGAQGVLLDEWWGFHPYTTWSTTTTANAELLLGEQDYSGSITRVGITRGYATRHGAGPFVSEDSYLDRILQDDCHHTTSEWQGRFRVGFLDLLNLRYAVQANQQVDCLAVTNLDHLAVLDRSLVVSAYQHQDMQFGSIPLVLDRSDWPARERQTAMLLQCQPVCELIKNADIPNLLQQELGIPVIIRSYGPTASAKEGLPQ